MGCAAVHVPCPWLATNTAEASTLSCSPLLIEAEYPARPHWPGAGQDRPAMVGNPESPGRTPTARAPGRAIARPHGPAVSAPPESAGGRATPRAPADPPA